MRNQTALRSQSSALAISLGTDLFCGKDPRVEALCSVYLVRAVCVCWRTGIMSWRQKCINFYSQ